MKEREKRPAEKRERGPAPEHMKLDLDPTEGLDRLTGKKPK